MLVASHHLETGYYLSVVSVLQVQPAGNSVVSTSSSTSAHFQGVSGAGSVDGRRVKRRWVCSDGCTNAQSVVGRTSTLPCSLLVPEKGRMHPSEQCGGCIAVHRAGGQHSFWVF